MRTQSCPSTHADLHVPPAPPRPALLLLLLWLLLLLCACGRRTGVLSMGRYDDPNSATSSFSILLGDAPHLDMHYAIFA